MKAKDILKRDDEFACIETPCEICRLHTLANDQIPDDILCPHCQNPININMFDMVIVGELPYYTEDQNVEKILVAECECCLRRVGLKPIPVIYNANHDIYYTGGNEFIATEMTPIISTDTILNMVKNYTDRIKNGETLEPNDLIIWLESECNKSLAKWLYDKGYKY